MTGSDGALGVLVIYVRIAMRALIAFVTFYIFLVSITGCQPVPSVPFPDPTTRDTTPPFLRLGSAGLRKDILLTQGSPSPERRRAKRTDEILLLATAIDRETGIKRVTLDITLQVVCDQTGTNQTFSETESVPPGSNSLPIQLAKQFAFRVAQKRAACGQRPSQVTLTIRAEAENGIGQVTRLPAAIISSFGPDVLRVGTFNLYRPGNHADNVFVRWGQTLGAKSDILLLTEVPDQRRAELLANAASMPYVVKMNNGDVAVASRAPIRNVQTRIIDPPGRLSSNDSYILSVESDIGGYPHQFIATHWGIRDTNDVIFGPESSSPSRLRAAQAILGLILPQPSIAFVGGDLNAFSGFGPQDHDDNPQAPDFVGSTAEVDLLRSSLIDPFVAMQKQNDVHCSNKRIDYVLIRGPYVPVKYEACFSESSPSDHPFVLVTFEAGD